MAHQNNTLSPSMTATLRDFLGGKALRNPLFAAKLRNPKKSIEECAQYILGEVYSRGCAGYDDDEIYNMAVHYYEEDNIEINKINGTYKVIVNHQVELTEEEKAEQRELAKKAFFDAERNRLHHSGRMKKNQPAQPQEEQEELTLFEI